MSATSRKKILPCLALACTMGGLTLVAACDEAPQGMGREAGVIAVIDDGFEDAGLADAGLADACAADGRCE